MINIDYWSKERIFKGGIILRNFERYHSQYVEIKLISTLREATIASQEKLSKRENQDYTFDIGRIISVGHAVEIEYPRYYLNSQGHYATKLEPGEPEVFAYSTPTWKFHRARPPVDTFQVFDKALVTLYGNAEYFSDLDPCAVVAQIIHGSGYQWIMLKEVERPEPNGPSTRRIMLRDYAAELELVDKYKSRLKV